MSNIVLYNISDDNFLEVINAQNYATHEVLKLQHILALAELEVIKACYTDNVRALAYAECIVRTAKKQLEQAENNKKICDANICYMRHMYE